MAVQVGSTKDAVRRNIMAVYGASGVGKTSLLRGLAAHAQATGGSVLQIDCDDGNLSLADIDLPSTYCEYLADVYEVLGWCATQPGWMDYSHIMIDGATALCETILQQYMSTAKDPRQAYGDMISAFGGFIGYIKRTFREKIIVVTFQQRYVQDDSGRMFYALDLPGNKLAPNMPYKFDEVFCLRILNDDKGVATRMLQCQPDMSYSAKDRSGKLQQFEPADLQHVINRIRGV